MKDWWRNEFVWRRSLQMPVGKSLSFWMRYLAWTLAILDAFITWRPLTASSGQTLLWLTICAMPVASAVGEIRENARLRRMLPASRPDALTEQELELRRYVNHSRSLQFVLVLSICILVSVIGHRLVRP